MSSPSRASSILSFPASLLEMSSLVAYCIPPMTIIMTARTAEMPMINFIIRFKYVPSGLLVSCGIKGGKRLSGIIRIRKRSEQVVLSLARRRTCSASVRNTGCSIRAWRAAGYLCLYSFHRNKNPFKITSSMIAG